MPNKINMLINLNRYNNNNVSINTFANKPFPMNVMVQKSVVSKKEYLSMNIININVSKGCGCGGAK